MATTNVTTTTEKAMRYYRFPKAYRIEHWIQVAAFTTLAITGLIQKGTGSSSQITGTGLWSGFLNALVALSKGLIGLLGGIENVRIIHRAAAIVLMVQVVYHIGVIIYRVYVKRYRMSMLPSLFDVKNAWTALLYNLHLSKKAPQQARYTFEEKAEYWALVWGTVVMIITGFMLWNPIATTRLLPGEFIPAAKSAHGNEALLAVLAIIIWHIYHVMIKTVNRSMFNGYLTEEQMLHEHPVELADLKAGLATPSVDPKAEAKRRAIFWPVYGIIGALLLVGIYTFVTFEQTAVSQRPSAENVEIFTPLTATPVPTLPPTATPAPTAAGSTAPTTWDGGIASLFKKCTGCHGSSGGLNLSSYQSAVAGGNTGAGIVPGSPETSQIVIKQAAGNHPGQLSPEELETIRQWIAAGAPEN